MIIATSTFFVSLLGIIALFSGKYRESKTGRTLFPKFREWADVKALELKTTLLWSRVEIGRLPPITVLLLRNLVREIALQLAALLRFGESQAHRLADIVSYKHRFEHRETRSEFLKQVADHKNGIDGRETTGPSEREESTG